MACRSSTENSIWAGAETVAFRHAFVHPKPPTLLRLPPQIFFPSPLASLPHFPVMKIAPLPEKEYNTWLPMIFGLLLIIGGLLVSSYLNTQIGEGFCHKIPLSLLCSCLGTGLALFGYAYKKYVENKLCCAEIQNGRLQCLALQKKLRNEEQSHDSSEKIIETQSIRKKKIEELENENIKLQKEIEEKEKLVLEISQLDMQSLSIKQNIEQLHQQRDKIKSQILPTTTLHDELYQKLEQIEKQILEWQSDQSKQLRDNALTEISKKRQKKQARLDQARDVSTIQADITNNKKLIACLQVQPLFSSQQSYTWNEKYKKWQAESQYIRTKIEEEMQVHHANASSNNLEALKAFRYSSLNMGAEIISRFKHQMHIIDTQYNLAKWELEYRTNLSSILPWVTKRSLRPLHKRLEDLTKIQNAFQEFIIHIEGLKNLIIDLHTAHMELYKIEQDPKNNLCNVPDRYLEFCKAESALSSQEVQIAKSMFNLFSLLDPKQSLMNEQSVKEKEKIAQVKRNLFVALQPVVDLYNKITRLDKDLPQNGDSPIRSLQARVENDTVPTMEKVSNMARLINAKMDLAESVIDLVKAQYEYIKLMHDLTKGSKDRDHFTKSDVAYAQSTISETMQHYEHLINHRKLNTLREEYLALVKQWESLTLDQQKTYKINDLFYQRLKTASLELES